jgi:hypothetical protein
LRIGYGINVWRCLEKKLFPMRYPIRLAQDVEDQIDASLTEDGARLDLIRVAIGRELRRRAREAAPRAHVYQSPPGSHRGGFFFAKIATLDSVA